MATASASTKRKRTVASALDWAAHRQEIEKLYLKEDKGLPAVMKIMREEHGFDASYVIKVLLLIYHQRPFHNVKGSQLRSKAQYEAQFKLWGSRFRKKMTQEHWRYAYFKGEERRKVERKSTLVFFNTNLISDVKARKEFGRHITATERFIPGKVDPELCITNTP